MIDFIYTEILFKPLYNALIFFVDVLPGGEFWLAVIVLTLIIKFVLYPLSLSSIKSQRAMQELQPKLNEIREEHKDDKQKQSVAMMKFYKKNKISPLSSCLPLLIQFPILIGMYRAFRDGLKPESLDFLYSFVARPEALNPFFLGFIDLSMPSIALAVVAGVAQFLQSWTLQSHKKKEEKKAGVDKKKKSPQDISSQIGTQMTYIFPVITVFIAVSLPSGLALYWIIVSLFGVWQQLYARKKYPIKLET